MNLFRNILSIITYLILIVNGSIEDNKNDTIDDKSYGKWNNQGHPHVPKINGTNLSTKRIFNYCASENGGKCEVEKVILNEVYFVNSDYCTVELSGPNTFNYTVVVNGEKIKTVVNFPIVRITSDQGSINAYRFGKVQAGYMVGALVAEVYDNPNPDPGACNTKTGVTELKSDFVTLTFKKGNEGFTCWGKNILRFKPGLRNPKF